MGGLLIAEGGRARSITLFVLGYVAIWMVAGIILNSISLIIQSLVPLSYLPAIVGAMIAFVWQCSPLKQHCLNRCHNHRELAAFGIAADLDVLRFGTTHALWCIGSCWALMLFPMLLLQGHFVAMLIVAFMILSERFERPKPLRWRLRFSSKLMRIIAVQAHMRLQHIPSLRHLWQKVWYVTVKH
jgi:predicted metal-binding membrane protein